MLSAEADFSLPALAEAMGMKSHASVQYARDRFAELTIGKRRHEARVPVRGGGSMTMTRAAELVRQEMDRGELDDR